MEKILKKYTTIPPHLYVNRKADEQLEDIINDMQRPGYVLVARQMGKTNLLFNAKRTMETDSRFFGYVDMSNVFKKERECYQNIIDFIIEPNQRFLSDGIEEKIDTLREKNLPPHKEYTKSLRIILNDFPGDIVIILDEIDALKTAEYSDNIFAQIRSNYFTRTNFPEFERLTYVLSGVIEPIELIKDRNKSPFNIGDKIYLDDFSKEEFDDFIKKSKLCLPEEIMDLLYWWTNGNPRLTFDICSEVETLALTGNNIDSQCINELINEKYLISFDHAPVDHIRELVKSNEAVRRAIRSIHEENTEKLSDEIKKKLYLFGVISSNLKESISFKNPIVKKSLSLKWLESIETEAASMKFTSTHGVAFVESHDYDRAIEVFEYLLSTGQENDTINYLLGFSYYKKSKVNKALNQFLRNFYEEPYKSRAICYRGMCKVHLGELAEGIHDLESVVNNKDDSTRHHAQLNLAQSLSSENSERAFNLLDELDGSIKDDNSDSLKLASLYCRSELHLTNGDITKALDRLSESLSYASVNESFVVKYKMALISGGDIELYESLVDIIITNKLTYSTENRFEGIFDEDNLIKCLNLIYDSENVDLFYKLLEYAVSNLYQGEDAKYNLIFSAAMYNGCNSKILDELIPFENKLNEDLQLKLCRQLAIVNLKEISAFQTYFSKFHRLVKIKSAIEESDVYLYCLYLQEMFEHGNMHEALILGDELTKRLVEQECKETLLLSTSSLYFWIAAIYANLNMIDLSFAYFEKTTSIIQNSKVKSTLYFKEAHFINISGFENKLKEKVEKPPERTYIDKKKFNNPNKVNTIKSYSQKEEVSVMYKDGVIKKGKYKKFAGDIHTSRCELINT